MDDFDVRSIGSLFEYTIPGEWGGDATPESGVPVLRATNFTDSGAIDYTDIVYREIPPSRLLSRRVTKGTILIEKSGGGPSKPAGRVVFCDSHFSGCASNFVEIAKVKKGFDANFVFYLLYYLYQIGLVVKYQQQTTGIINFKLDQYKDEKVSIPRSTAEQTEIAAILTTIDKAISQTEAIIAKQQRIKTGLLQDLLTRGIDEHGNIRSEATHAFKDSPLGRIPAEWELKSLSDAFAMPPRNGIYKPAQQIGEGSLLIGQNAFTRDGTLDYALARRAFVNAAELETFGLQEGDLLVSRVFATADGVGKPVAVSDLPEPAVYESNMLRLRFNTDCVHPGFVFHWLLSHQMRLAITSSVNASNQVSINQKTLNTLPIVIPKKCEQERILGVIVTATEAQLDLKRSLVKLRRNKSALMQDLLTGKVRVTPLLEAGA